MNFPIGYGINPEQPQETTEPQQAVEEEVVACPMPKRKRARVKGGQFAADDPTTEVNEAWAES
jgi:hypothetical protein